MLLLLLLVLLLLRLLLMLLLLLMVLCCDGVSDNFWQLAGVLRAGGEHVPKNSDG